VDILTPLLVSPLFLVVLWLTFREKLLTTQDLTTALLCGVGLGFILSEVFARWAAAS
jgi:hypothetical protein